MRCLSLLMACCIVALLSLSLPTVQAALFDFVVTTSGNRYRINSGSTDNEGITVVRGQTYKFDLTAVGEFHPFWIIATEGAFTSLTGISYSDANKYGNTLTWTVPTSTPSTVYYECSVHTTQMLGTIHVVDPSSSSSSSTGQFSSSSSVESSSSSFSSSSTPTITQTFVVTTSGLSYRFDGSSTSNPTITVTRGLTYVFDLTAVGSFHPFWIITTAGTFVSVSGVSYSTANKYGNTLTWTVPNNSPSSLSYECDIHLTAMLGTITVISASSSVSSSSSSSSSSTGVSAISFSSSSSSSSTGTSVAATFVLSTSGSSAYLISGFSGNNPTISVQRGLTYTFNLTAVASIHPTFIVSTLGTFINVAGVSYSDSNKYGNILTWTVSSTAPSTVYYQCENHPAAMQGIITVTDVPTSTAAPTTTTTMAPSTTMIMAMTLAYIAKQF